MSKPSQLSFHPALAPVCVADAQLIQDELQHIQERLAQVSRQIQIDQVPTFITIYNRGVQRHIRIDEILIVRSEGNYTRFYLTTELEILSCHTLKYWHGEITHPDIKRAHASYMINTKYIEQVDKKQNLIILKNGNVAKVSRRYKALF